MRFPRLVERTGTKEGIRDVLNLGGAVGQRERPPMPGQCGGSLRSAAAVGSPGAGRGAGHAGTCLVSGARLGGTFAWRGLCISSHCGIGNGTGRGADGDFRSVPRKQGPSALGDRHPPGSRLGIVQRAGKETSCRSGAGGVSQVCCGSIAARLGGRVRGDRGAGEVGVL